MLVYEFTKHLVSVPQLLGLAGDINTFPRLEVTLNSSDNNDDKDNSSVDVDYYFDIITKSRNKAECLRLEAEVLSHLTSLGVANIDVNMLNFNQTNYPSELTGDDKYIYRAIINPIFTISKR